MKRKLISLLILFSFFGLVTPFLLKKSPIPSYFYVRIPVDFTSSNQPKVDVKIGNTNYPFLIDTGLFYPLSLQKEILESLDKKTPIESVKFIGMKDIVTSHASYIIPQIGIRNLQFYNMETMERTREEYESTILYHRSDRTIEEKYQEASGAIGYGLLRLVNFLFDFENSVMIASKNINELKKDGYAVEKFVNVPFITRGGIVFNIDTDLGMKRFLLDTGCTASIMRSSNFTDQSLEELIPGSGLQAFRSSKFVIGDRDFGKKKLMLLEMKNYLPDEIDGVLGMDFLSKVTVYIDWDKKLLYFGNNSDNFVGRLPVYTLG